MKIYAKQQSGFTIIEFMIAGTLGLILLAGLMMMFINSQQTSRSTRAQLDIQNEGRFAMRFMTTQIQQTGWVGVGNYAEFQAKNAMAPLTNLGEDNVASTVLGGMTLEASDSITVNYEGVTDCNGSAGGPVISDQFTVITSGSTPALACNGEPVVNNVESFQVQYMIDVLGSSQWVNASAVTDANAVRAVRLNLLLASPENAADANLARSFTLLDEAQVDRNDRKLRQVFSSTVELNNMRR